MKKVTKNKSEFYIQTVCTPSDHDDPVKFQRNWSKTIGGVAYTRYLLLEGGRKDRRMELRKDGMSNTMSPRFSLKRLA